MVLMSGMAMHSSAASFDCAKASTDVEKMICADVELSSLDEQLAKTYKASMERVVDISGLKKEQREWLKLRNTCKNETCLKYSYGAIIEWLNKIENVNSKEYITYEDIHKEVPVKLYKKETYEIPNFRPENSFQLAGSANDKICNEALEAFNEKGLSDIKVDNDIVWWWINNSHLIPFIPLETSRKDNEIQMMSYKNGLLDFVAVDIDGDGREEYVLRDSGMLNSNYNQDFAIYDHDLVSNHIEIDCKKSSSRLSRDCRMDTRWIHNLNAWNDKEAVQERWLSTGQNLHLQANTHNYSDALFYLLELSSGIYVMSMPSAIGHMRPPVEIVLFKPEKNRIGNLQCILKPVFWNYIKPVEVDTGCTFNGRPVDCPANHKGEK